MLFVCEKDVDRNFVYIEYTERGRWVRGQCSCYGFFTMGCYKGRRTSYISHFSYTCILKNEPIFPIFLKKYRCDPSLLARFCVGMGQQPAER